MKKGQPLYFADTDKNRVLKVLFLRTQTEVMLESNCKISEELKKVTDSIYHIEIPQGGTMHISKDSLFDNPREAEESIKKNLRQTRIFTSMKKTDGLGKSLKCIIMAQTNITMKS